MLRVFELLVLVFLTVDTELLRVEVGLVVVTLLLVPLAEFTVEREVPLVAVGLFAEVEVVLLEFVFLTLEFERIFPLALLVLTTLSPPLLVVNSRLFVKPLFLLVKLLFGYKVA